MKRNPAIRIAANVTISRYLERGYIEEVQQSDQQWLLPIFAVENSRKIRLVWDAAAECEGHSLDKHLLQGPNVNAPLWDILVRFREDPIALCADISEMYHQVMVAEEDRKYQRFLWRNNDQEPLKVYEMRVMTFGANCSPYIAQFVKNKNAEAFKERFPEAAPAIIQNHYVDDWVQSCRDPEEACALAKDVVEVQSQAGFKLLKWVSNRQEVIDSVDGGENPLHTSVLGVRWNTQEDTMSYKISPSTVIEPNDAPTKRQMLSAIMNIFDPLGHVSHITIGGRLALRSLED